MIYYSKRILIIEDNEVNVKLLRDIQEWHGYETLQTGDGWEAINLALTHRKTDLGPPVPE